MKASAVLLSWRRPDNLADIVAALRASGAIGEVLVWNNNPDVRLELEAAAVIQAPANMFLLPRLAVGCLARWPAIWFQDDDLVLAPAQVAELWDRFVADGGRRIHGVQGRMLAPNGAYDGRNVFGDCDIVNQAVVFRRAALARALGWLPSPLWEPGTVDPAEDDILLSLAQGRRQAVAVDVGALERRGAYDDMAWSRRPEHRARRQAMVDWMLLK